MQPTTLTDIRIVGVNVRDPDAAIAFYRDTLGFDLRRDLQPGGNQRWIEVAPAGAAVTLALIHRPDAAGTDTGIRFSVPDAAAEHTAMGDKGVQTGEVLRWPGVPPMFTFDDPDGNRFYVIEG